MSTYAKTDEINQLINAEIEWCLNNAIEDFSPEFRNGFVSGLRQAIYLVGEYAKKIEVINMLKEYPVRQPEVLSYDNQTHNTRSKG